MTRVAGVLALAAAAAACAGRARPPIVQPGAPGAPARVIGAHAAADIAGVVHTAAEARFVRRMIAHHAQALEMTALVPSRSLDPLMRKLAERIELSQADEIRFMREWLDARGERAPASGEPHDHGDAVPGMLTAEELQRLAAAAGAAFDRLFLELMIKHHEGALAMVAELLAAPDGTSDPELFAFATSVETDQRMEIARMRAMLEERRR
ncbi:MAG TPA: DUF305 domain-containing protein [Vicinamibacterales bacterium]|nr:DUF305 domain-containing protein [Vicinamibacterales bacterium]